MPRSKTPRKPNVAPAPTVAVKRETAAAMLEISLGHFEQHVQPHIKLLPSGQLLLVPIAEVERWVREQARHMVKT